MRMITAAAYVAAVIIAIAACGGSQPKAAASHAATRTSASASASSTLDMTGIPVITVDANGHYWALVPDSQGIGNLQHICSQDQPQLLQRLEQAGGPATGAVVDLHGPGNPNGNTTGNTYALGSGDFAILGNNEGLCGVLPPGG